MNLSQYERWADVRETSLEVAAACHEAATPRRSPEEIWADPTINEYAFCQAYANYLRVKTGSYQTLHWGCTKFTIDAGRTNDILATFGRKERVPIDRRLLGPTWAPGNFEDAVLWFEHGAWWVRAKENGEWWQSPTQITKHTMETLSQAGARLKKDAPEKDGE